MNPLKEHPWFSLLFGVIVLAEMIGISGYPQVRLASKGMIMASLIGFYILRAKRQDQILLLGMVFALLGDAFLLFDGESFFLIGLGCFLIMQLCYISSFYKQRRIPRNRDKLIVLFIALIPILFLTIFWTSLRSLKLPVLIYAISITAMLIFAFLRHPALNGYVYVLLGAVLFTTSDAVLGINKFFTELPYSDYIVMGTYIAAQYLIITGVLAADRPKPKDVSILSGSFGRHKV